MLQERAFVAEYKAKFSGPEFNQMCTYQWAKQTNAPSRPTLNMTRCYLQRDKYDPHYDATKVKRTRETMKVQLEEGCKVLTPTAFPAEGTLKVSCSQLASLLTFQTVATSSVLQTIRRGCERQPYPTLGC